MLLHPCQCDNVSDIIDYNHGLRSYTRSIDLLGNDDETDIFFPPESRRTSVSAITELAGMLVNLTSLQITEYSFNEPWDYHPRLDQVRTLESSTCSFPSEDTLHDFLRAFVSLDFLSICLVTFQDEDMPSDEIPPSTINVKKADISNVNSPTGVRNIFNLVFNEDSPKDVNLFLDEAIVETFPALAIVMDSRVQHLTLSCLDRGGE